MVSAGASALARDPLYTWLKVEKPAPQLEFLMDKATLHKLADFKGNVVLLNLWATWCTPCLKELPTLQKLDEKYAAEGLVVIPMSIDTFEFKRLKKYMEDKNWEFPHLAQDRSQTFQHALVERGLPVTYLIGRDGTMLSKYEGATDWMQEEQQQKIRDALKSKAR